MAAEPKSRGKGFQDERYRIVISELVAERKRQRLSQEALADRLDRHQQFVSRYEIGERRLDIVEFVDVAKALGLNPADMVQNIS